MIGRRLASVLLASAVLSAPCIGQEREPMFLVKNRGFWLLDGAGKEVSELPGSGGTARFAADGTQVAYTKFDRATEQTSIVVRDLKDNTEATIMPRNWSGGGTSCDLFWRGDGKQILVVEGGNLEDGVQKKLVRTYDLETHQIATIAFPKTAEWIYDWSPDGKSWLFSTEESGLARAKCEEGSPIDFLDEEGEVLLSGQFSPDGKKVACRYRVGDYSKNNPESKLMIVDLETGRRSRINFPGFIWGHCWSPDGERLAFTAQKPLRDLATAGIRKTYLMTCQADGGSLETITARGRQIKGGSEGMVLFFQVFDWR